MTGKPARKLFPLIIVGLFCAHAGTLPGTRSSSLGEPPKQQVGAERTVFLAGEMSDEERIVFTAAVAAAQHPGVVLFDTPTARPHLARFLSDFSAAAVHPVGRFAENDDLARRLGREVNHPFLFRHDRPGDLWRTLFPNAERIVVCPASPRPLLMQAAVLAAVARAPLFVVHPNDGEFDLRHWVETWKVRELLAVGDCEAFCKAIPGVRVQRFPDEARVVTACLSHLSPRGPVRALVVANPEDAGLATLAPWIAAQRRAILLLTNAKGDNVRPLVEAAVKRPPLRAADHLLIVADRKAIPVEKRANPLAGKDAEIEMEPMTPAEGAPFEFATGRLFDEDYGTVALQLARQRTLNRGAAHKALVASNPSSDLALLETLSRHSALELKNRGFETTALFGKTVTKDDVRRRLQDCDLFLWEGHHATLVKDYGFLEWNEPLKPSLVVLQSCLALTEEKALPVLRRGSVAVVGSSTRTYSASGGAFSLAFLDAMLYDDQTLGGALRQAKNFLLCYQMLKEKRLGAQAKLGGANLRSAWAFSLWGDPTLKFPLPEPDGMALAAVQHHVKRIVYKPDAEETAKTHSITVEVPDSAYDKVSTGKFQAKVRPNMRLAGLIRTGDEEGKTLVPFLFAEVSLPNAPAGKKPLLHGKIPEEHWAFLWDARRRVGYLLVLPRVKDTGEVRFTVEWMAK